MLAALSSFQHNTGMVDWFNHRRLLEPNGNIPPAEAEANCYGATAAIVNLIMAA